MAVVAVVKSKTMRLLGHLVQVVAVVQTAQAQLLVLAELLIKVLMEQETLDL
jgi:hypothetical protein